MASARAGPRDLLVAGHVNVDHFLAVDRFPGVDRTAPIVAERTELGGTAANLALAAAARGVRVGLLARVGDGFPLRFRSVLASAGIDLRGLVLEAGTPTPTCTIVEDCRGRSRTLIQQGPMGAAPRSAEPGAWWRSYRWLHLSTGAPAYHLRLAQLARRRGAHVALDPAQEILYRWDRATFRRIAPSAELLFGNRAEVAQAVEWLGAGGAARLVDHVPLVVRTEGADGASAFFRGGRVHVSAPRPRRLTTLVGAGDAFRGGFYGAWFAGASLRDCLVAGTRGATARIEGRR